MTVKELIEHLNGLGSTMEDEQVRFLTTDGFWEGVNYVYVNPKNALHLSGVILSDEQPE